MMRGLRLTGQRQQQHLWVFLLLLAWEQLLLLLLRVLLLVVLKAVRSVAQMHLGQQQQQQAVVAVCVLQAAQLQPLKAVQLLLLLQLRVLPQTGVLEVVGHAAAKLVLVVQAVVAVVAARQRAAARPQQVTSDHCWHGSRSLLQLGLCLLAVSTAPQDWVVVAAGRARGVAAARPVQVLLPTSLWLLSSTVMRSWVLTWRSLTRECGSWIRGHSSLEIETWLDLSLS